MKHFKPLIILLIITLIGVFTVGCREKENSKTKPISESGTVEELEEPTKTTESEHEDDLGVTMLTLYFADEQATFLLAEEREVPKTDTSAEAAIEELIEGPEETGHISTIPKGTRLNGITIEDKIAHVDFSEEFKTNYQLGSAAEVMTVYSIVNTLTEFSTIDKVKFLVDGQALEIAGSNFDFKVQEFSRNTDVIKGDN